MIGKREVLKREREGLQEIVMTLREVVIILKGERGGHEKNESGNEVDMRKGSDVTERSE